MSGFGNFIAGAVGGGGAAVASISSKYIDDEITRSRAQALADIQRNSAVQQTKELDAYQNSPERRANLREIAAADARSANEVALEGRVNEATNPSLRQARIDNENAFVAGTAGTKLDEERIRRLVLDPMDVRKQKEITNNSADASIRVHEATEAAREARERAVRGALDKLPEAKKLEVQQIGANLKEINKAIVEAQANGSWDPERNKGQKSLEVSRSAMQKRARDLLGGGGDDDQLGIFPGDVAASTQAQVTKPPATTASVPTTAARPNLMEEAAKRIPSPPPQTIQQGLSTKPNPAFAAWREKYGDAWERQEQERERQRQAESARLKEYNPYKQARPL